MGIKFLNIKGHQGALMRHLSVFTVFVLLHCFSSQASEWDDVFGDRVYKNSKMSVYSADIKNFGGRKYTPPLFESSMMNGRALPSLAQITRNMMLDKKQDLSTLIVYTMARTGNGVRRDLVGDPVRQSRARSQKKRALLQAFKKVWARKGQTPPAGLAAKIKPIPADIQELAAFLLEVSLTSMDWHKKAFQNKKGSVKQVQKILGKYTNYIAGIGDAIDPELMAFADSVDMKYLASGAVDLAVAVEDAKARLLERKNTEKFRFQVSTPLGKIILNGAGESNNIQGPVLLALDLGGDDTWVSSSGSSYSRSVNMVIDVAGNDHWLAGKDLKTSSMDNYEKRTDVSIPPDQGSGYFGYSFVLDMDGRDIYRARSFSQGSGVFGFGVIWDLKGDDTFDCYSFCQASSLFGGGFLLDSDGKDSYSGFRSLQAFAATNGSSLLMDLGKGSDSFLAYTSPLDFPSLIDPKVNSSFAQGTSLGKRSDIIDGYSWAGGVAVLIDDGGDNTFKAGFFAQGFAYWYGLAMLLTSEGNDQYLSDKYSAGSATHYGIGILYDKGGNDTYRVSQELGLGVGHDFSYGVLIDLKGNDKYTAANLSLGCGSANGMGFFWDNEGDDTYTVSAKQFMGCAIDRVGRHSLRNRNHTLGVFVDADGKDQVDSPHDKLKGKIRSKTWRHDPGLVTPEFSKPFFKGGGFFLSDSLKEFPDGVDLTGSQVF